MTTLSKVRVLKKGNAQSSIEFEQAEIEKKRLLRLATYRKIELLAMRRPVSGMR
jgi:hypothetical protein